MKLDLKEWINNSTEWINGVKVQGHSLILGSTATTTSTVYNTYNGRKFSDYDIIVFLYGTSQNDIRDTRIMYQTMWSSGVTVRSFILHGSTSASASASQVSTTNVTYRDDTSVTASVGNSGLVNYFTIIGLRIVGGVVRKLLKALQSLTLERGWAV